MQRRELEWLRPATNDTKRAVVMMMMVIIIRPSSRRAFRSVVGPRDERNDDEEDDDHDIHRDRHGTRDSCAVVVTPARDAAPRARPRERRDRRPSTC